MKWIIKILGALIVLLVFVVVLVLAMAILKAI